ncbi:MAG: Lsr2 family protein [Actinophytocola sp.]|nr:Lsr2 family protein [Actinophytocola sp.]
MAENVAVTTLDDIDGSEAIERVRFALDGVSYQIDLSEQNARELRTVLGKYTRKARRVRGSGQQRSANGAVSRPPDREVNQQIREWARQQGWDVSDRGRLPSSVIDAYHESRRPG